MGGRSSKAKVDSLFSEDSMNKTDANGKLDKANAEGKLDKANAHGKLDKTDADGGSKRTNVDEELDKSKNTDEKMKCIEVFDGKGENVLKVGIVENIGRESVINSDAIPELTKTEMELLLPPLQSSISLPDCSSLCGSSLVLLSNLPIPALPYSDHMLALPENGNSKVRVKTKDNSDNNNNNNNNKEEKKVDCDADKEEGKKKLDGDEGKGKILSVANEGKELGNDGDNSESKRLNDGNCGSYCESKRLDDGNYGNYSESKKLDNKGGDEGDDKGDGDGKEKIKDLLTIAPNLISRAKSELKTFIGCAVDSLKSSIISAIEEGKFLYVDDEEEIYSIRSKFHCFLKQVLPTMAKLKMRIPSCELKTTIIDAVDYITVYGNFVVCLDCASNVILLKWNPVEACFVCSGLVGVDLGARGQDLFARPSRLGLLSVGYNALKPGTRIYAESIDRMWNIFVKEILEKKYPIEYESLKATIEYNEAEIKFCWYNEVDKQLRLGCLPEAKVNYSFSLQEGSDETGAPVIIKISKGDNILSLLDREFSLAEKILAASSDMKFVFTIRFVGSITRECVNARISMKHWPVEDVVSKNEKHEYKSMAAKKRKAKSLRVGTATGKSIASVYEPPVTRSRRKRACKRL